MSLINCPECKKNISEKAPNCPTCGCPIAGNKTEAITGVSAIIVLTGMFLTILSMVLFMQFEILQNGYLIFGVSSIPTIIAFIISSLRKK